MKVKDLTKKYQGYHIIEKGYPDSTPFFDMPKELQGLYGKEYAKALSELKVYGYRVKHKPHVAIDITSAVFGGKKRPNTHYKGTVEIYLKGRKNHR